MGGTCGMEVVEDRCIQGLGGEAWREGTTWKTECRMR